MATDQARLVETLTAFMRLVRNGGPDPTLTPVMDRLVDGLNIHVCQHYRLTSTNDDMAYCLEIENDLLWAITVEPGQLAVLFQYNWALLPNWPSRAEINSPVEVTFGSGRRLIPEVNYRMDFQTAVDRNIGYRLGGSPVHSERCDQTFRLLATNNGTEPVHIPLDRITVQVRLTPAPPPAQAQIRIIERQTLANQDVILLWVEFPPDQLSLEVPRLFISPRTMIRATVSSTQTACNTGPCPITLITGMGPVSETYPLQLKTETPGRYTVQLLLTTIPTFRSNHFDLQVNLPAVSVELQKYQPGDRVRLFELPDQDMETFNTPFAKILVLTPTFLVQVYPLTDGPNRWICELMVLRKSRLIWTSNPDTALSPVRLNDTVWFHGNNLMILLGPLANGRVSIRIGETQPLYAGHLSLPSDQGTAQIVLKSPGLRTHLDLELASSVPYARLLRLPLQPVHDWQLSPGRFQLRLPSYQLIGSTGQDLPLLRLDSSAVKHLPSGRNNQVQFEVQVEATREVKLSWTVSLVSSLVHHKLTEPVNLICDQPVVLILTALVAPVVRPAYRADVN